MVVEVLKEESRMNKNETSDDAVYQCCYTTPEYSFICTVLLALQIYSQQIVNFTVQYCAFQ